MTRTPSRRYSIGTLVSAAYKQAGLVTQNRRVAAVVASQILETWLCKSDRPDLIRALQTNRM